MRLAKSWLEWSTAQHRSAPLSVCDGVTICIGTAGWSIPRQIAGSFPEEGTALERYAAKFSVVEINSSFHR
jgi:hypothetical protein